MNRISISAKIHPVNTPKCVKAKCYDYQGYEFINYASTIPKPIEQVSKVLFNEIIDDLFTTRIANGW